MAKASVKVLEYKGTRDQYTFKVLPFNSDHPEREITFVRGVPMRAGIDISEEAYIYLVRDYRNELEVYTEDIPTSEIFRFQLEKMLSEIDISKDDVYNAVNKIYNKKTRKPRKERVS